MYIFRNYTVENLFPEDTVFSGYGDVSVVPNEEKELIWFYQVPITFDSSSLIAEVESMRDKLELVISQMRSGQILYVLSLENLFPLHFADMDQKLENAVASFNDMALALEDSNPNIRFIDFSEYLSGFTSDQWISWRFYFISQMIIAPEVANGFYTWFRQRISQISGQRKKCLVLDLDNTLWGGVLGEDGVDGIKIGGDYPGNAFLYFQEGIVELGKRGIIITVCSKNNETDVLEAWKSNPFIKLKDQHIATYRINWNNKADNIREIAKELNIGLDSMVFIDDNPSERELVRKELPMVEVPDFPKRPYGLMPLLRNLTDNYFRAYELTSEDLKKTEQYKANAQRSAMQHKFADMTDFIRSLNIEIDILGADRFNIPRIAQMTQKTNQFNLTTHRYTEADISDFVERGDMVACISVRDKFGDNGITGAVIVRMEDDGASIDSLLLSCRILGKGIEMAFLKSILNILKHRGIKSVTSQYIPTAKNGLVSDFYDKLGFSKVNECDGVKTYKLQLDANLEIEDYYKISIQQYFGYF